MVKAKRIITLTVFLIRYLCAIHSRHINCPITLLSDHLSNQIAQNSVQVVFG